jgi:hypothetical protein
MYRTLIVVIRPHLSALVAVSSLHAPISMQPGAFGSWGAGTGSSAEGIGRGVTVLPGPRIDGVALPEAYPQSVATSGDGRKLLIVAQEGGCGEAGAELAEQSSERVVVTLVETEPPEEKEIACTMDIRFETVSVTLDEPLGERTVVLKYEHRKG